MANVNKKIISKGKATEEKEKKSSKSPVTVEVVDGVFVFHGGKGGHNITERKNKALEPYDKCIYSYGLLLELIPGDQTSRINQNIGNCLNYRTSVHWQIQQKCRPGKKAIPDGT